MQRRTLRLDTYDDILRDADRLLAAGYDRAGNWDLAQIGHHLAIIMTMSLDGFPQRLPRPVQWVARRLMLGRILRRHVFRVRFPAPAYVRPPDEHDDRAAVDRLRAAVARLRDHSGPLHPSPMFGDLSPAEWREVHLWHSEHHLSFLLPRPA